MKTWDSSFKNYKKFKTATAEHETKQGALLSVKALFDCTSHIQPHEAGPK